jgi:hypothetical protein
MPAFPDPLDVPRNKSGSVSLQFRDHRGTARSTTIEGANVTDALRDAFITAAGACTNAALVKSTVAKTDEVGNIANPAVVTYDEAYSSTDHVLVVSFLDDSGRKQMMELPAPDLSLFEGDRMSLNPAQDQAEALITAAKAILNSFEDGGEEGTYQFARGFLSTRSAGRRRKLTTLAIEEPEAGDLPAPAPGE